MSLELSLPCTGLIELGDDLVAHTDVRLVGGWHLLVGREKCCEVYAAEGNDMRRKLEIHYGSKAYWLWVRTETNSMTILLTCRW